MSTSKAAIEPLAVTINEAAGMVGLSRSKFYEVYLTPGLVKAIPAGRQARVIDVQELRAAYRQFIERARAAAGNNGDTH